MHTPEPRRPIGHAIACGAGTYAADRALRLLADAPEGMTEALMMAHGFNSELLVDLCIAGLAIAKVERMIAGGRTVEVVRLKITEAGRQALTASRGKST